MRPTHFATFYVLLSIAALAQSDRGSITGTVSDPAHAMVPRATVRATNTQTGVQYDSVTTQTPLLPAAPRRWDRSPSR